MHIMTAPSTVVMEAAKQYFLDNPGTTISSAARLFGVNRSTLSRQLRGVTMSREAYLQQTNRKLSIAQEKRLIKHINVLTERGNAPKYPMINRFTAEISGKSMGKNWAARFVKRFSGELSSSFLQAIEASRTKADSVVSYQRWFDQVCVVLLSNSTLLIDIHSFSLLSIGTEFSLTIYTIWMKRA
jgi:transposase-like protein